MELRDREKWFNREVSEGLTSPFLCHVELSDDEIQETIQQVRQFTSWKPERFLRLQKLFPLVSVWSICYILSENYGEDGTHKVWPLVSEGLNIPLESQLDRRQIALNFREICDRFFLCYATGKRAVDTFISQAGVSKYQFDPVIRTFWNSERINGCLPSLENTEELNTWEDAAARYLTFNPRAQLVLLADFQAYYATIFIRCRRGQPARNSFEAAFHERVNDWKSVQSSISKITFIPHLVWNERLFAVMPQHAGTYLLRYRDPVQNIEAQPRRLRARQKWPLPSPWPKNLIVMHESADAEVSLFRALSDILVFSAETGHHISTLESRQTGQFSLNESNVVLVSQSQFSLNQFQSQQRGALHVLEKVLSHRGEEILFSDSSLGMVNVRPRIKSRVIGSLPLQLPDNHIKVLARDSEIQIETTQLQTKCWVEVNDITGMEIAFDEKLTETLNLRDFIAPSEEALFVNVTLKVAKNGRVLQRSRYLFLPFVSHIYEDRFLQFETGVSPLTNFELNKCEGVILQEHGARLDDSFTSDYATLFLKLGKKRQTLIWPNTIDRIEYFFDRGDKHNLLPGSEIEVGPKFNDDYVVLHCQNKEAKLEIGGRIEERPFKNGRMYTIRLSEFLTQGKNPDINVLMHDMKIPWLRVKRSLSPQAFELKNRTRSISCSLMLNTPIDYLVLEFQDISGTTQSYTTSFSHRPSPMTLPPWISIEIVQPSLAASIRFDRTKYTGLPLVCVLKATVNSDGETFNLTDDEGGRCVIGMLDVSESQDIPLNHLTRMGEWLNVKMHQSSSRQLQDTIGNIYDSEIKRLAQSSRHQSQLLKLYESSITGNVVDFGKKIPSEIPDIFSFPNHAFVAFPAYSEDLAEKSFRHLFELRNHSLQQATKDKLLDHHIAAAYSNFAIVAQNGGNLRGFEFKRFEDLFRGPLEGSGNFGLLTPDHYTKAIKQFLLRMSDLGFGEDFAPSQFETLLRLPTSLRNIPIDVILWPEEIFTTYEDSLQDTVKLLSAFAKASRNGLAKEFIAQLSSATSIDEAKITNCLALCIEAGLEVFSFYLLLWDIVKRNP